MSTRFLRIAAVYFVAAVTLGFVHGHDREVHAGPGPRAPEPAGLGVNGAIPRLIYHAFPAAGQTKLAAWHFLDSQSQACRSSWPLLFVDARR